jgi:hypothetical protein
MKNFAPITSNFYRGSAPTEEELNMLVDLFGVRRVISLDYLTGKLIRSWNKDRFEHIFLPLDPNAQEKNSFYSFLFDHISDLCSSQTTFIHCLHGQDRTGLAVALYRIASQFWPAQQAYQEARKFNFCDGVKKGTRKFFLSLLSEKENENTDKNEIIDPAIQGSSELINYEYFLPPLTNPYQLFSGIGQEQIYRSLDNTNNVLEGKDPGYFNIPPVGGTAGVGPMMGAGPVENSGISNFR